jgi:hypothetical protein
MLGIEFLIFNFLDVLTKEVFKRGIDTMESVSIEQAPSWYQQNDKDNLTVYITKVGSIDIIDSAKDIAKKRMMNNIEDIIDISIYETFKDKKYDKFIDRVKQDDKLYIFVNKNILYPKIEYTKEQKESFFSSYKEGRVFIKAIIPKDAILIYQKDRINKINYSISHDKAKKNFEDMD